MGRHDDEQKPFLPFEQIVQSEDAFAFRGAQLARTQKPAKPAIGRPICGIGENVWRAVDENEPRADEQFRRLAALLANFVQPLIGAHNSRQRVAVGDPDGGVTMERRRRNQLLRV